MIEPNYESKWWGYIYDQMMGDQLNLIENHSRFYQSNLKGVAGPVLECACGTGIFLLPLLASGHDIYGLDISHSMLATLKKKAKSQGIENISDRIFVEDMGTFRFDRRFNAIIISTNSFLMLSTQEAQIRVLQNIFTHLTPGGRLLLDIRLAGFTRWECFSTPEREPLRVGVDEVNSYWIAYKD
jgi:SAM-dependent methyltransferase